MSSDYTLFTKKTLTTEKAPERDQWNVNNITIKDGANEITGCENIT
jgi:hypothetical protein